MSKLVRQLPLLSILAAATACGVPQNNVTEDECDCPSGWSCDDGVCKQPTVIVTPDDGTCEPACGDGLVCRNTVCVPGGTDEREHSTSGTSWTFLVYMVADNNLEPAGVSDLQEMMSVGSTDSVNIVVQADRAQGYSADPVGGLGDWTSTKRLLVNGGSLREVADLGEVNMGEPSVLADFIAWGVQEFPADRTAIIFWDHGGAWPGFGGDESTADHDLLSLAELRRAMADGMQAAGLEQFALIGFDACLMATYETAQVMRPFGEYLLASEELEPGHGWDYASLQILASDPSTPPRALGEAIIQGFANQAQASGTANEITLSLTDLYNLGPLDAALASFVTAVAGSMGEHAAVIGQQRYNSLGFGRNPDPTVDTHMVDIGHLLQNLATGNSFFQSHAADIEAALKAAVVAKHNGPVTTGAHGIAVYFPPSTAYYQQTYDQLPEMANWREFLTSFYGAGSQIGSAAVRFTNPDKVADVSFENDVLYIGGQLAPESVSSVAAVTVLNGVADQTNGLVYLVGDSAGELDENGVAFGAWDLSILVMVQGESYGYAYYSVQYEGEYVRASIPLAYESPTQGEQIAFLSYILDQQGNALQATYYLLTEAGYGELYPEPGSTIYPLLQVTDGNTTDWQVAGDGIDPNAEFMFDVIYLQQGATAYVQLNALDYAGNGDFVYYTGTL